MSRARSLGRRPGTPRRAALVGVAVLALAAPIGLAPASAADHGPGYGQGSGAGGGPGSGEQLDISTLRSGSLTSTQRARLASMADEEKLALDVYRALAKRFPSTPVFANIARYRIADPTKGKAAGSYASSRVRGLYSALLRTSTTTAAAYAAGRAIERDDLAELAKAKLGVAAPDVLAVYANLTTGSQRHLKAFNG